MPYATTTLYWSFLVELCCHCLAKKSTLTLQRLLRRLKAFVLAVPFSGAGVIRAIPVGVAYRDASADVLREAVDAAVVFTHPTERGSEGAVVIAAAVAWLIK
jgi:ADP-ribosylglycohydrolase